MSAQDLHHGKQRPRSPRSEHFEEARNSHLTEYCKKMDIILHVGPPKTGTTALQNALFDSRDQLLDYSVLYPAPEKTRAKNHGQLCALFVPYADAPRGMKKVPEAEYIDGGRLLERKIQNLVTNHAPKVLILSSEWFTLAHDAEHGQKLLDFIESFRPRNVEVLLYARRPSSIYLSDAQQRLRAASVFEPVFDRNIYSVIAGFRCLCPTYKVSVRTYDHRAFFGGNIVTDFAETYLPECKKLLDRSKIFLASNQSISAEAMVVLQDFRRYYFAHQEDVFNRETKRLLSRLRRIDAVDGHPRPKLVAAWRNYFDYGDDRALKLRDDCEVVFSDFDYARLENGDFASCPPHSPDVADKVEIDTNRLNCVIDRLGKSTLSPTRSGTRWLTELARQTGTGQLPSLPLWRKLLQ